MSDATSRVRLRRAAVVALAVAALVALLVSVAARRGAGPLDAASATIGDDGRFETATDAGITLVAVSAQLADAAERCDTTRHDGPARCGALFTAAAVTRVAAVNALECTRPHLDQLRRDLRSYLDELDDDPHAEPPPPPVCD